MSWFVSLLLPWKKLFKQEEKQQITAGSSRSVHCFESAEKKYQNLDSKFEQIVMEWKQLIWTNLLTIAKEEFLASLSRTSQNINSFVVLHQCFTRQFESQKNEQICVIATSSSFLLEAIVSSITTAWGEVWSCGGIQPQEMHCLRSHSSR